MIKFIKAWLERRRQERWHLDWARGYRWAMAELHAKRMTPEQIYDRCDNPFEGRNAFDDGAKQAVYNWELAAVEPDEVKEP